MTNDPQAWKNYKAGGIDSFDRKIEAILCMGTDYIIYEAEMILRVQGDAAASLDPQIFERVLKATAMRPSNAMFRRRLYQQVATALSQGLDGDRIGAVACLDGILARLSSTSIATARLRYIWSAFLLCAVVWSVFAFCRSRVLLPPEDLLWIQMVAFGGTGALFSVLINQQKIPIDLDHSWLVHCTAGASRVLVGVIASLACYTAIKAGIILSFVEQGSGYGLLFFCLLSGFSETFVPNLLNEEDSHGTSRNKA
jgi:hypothetical protein